MGCSRFRVHPKVTIETAPQLVTRPLRKAVVTSISQMAYVRDWKIEIVQPGDVTLADPHVDVMSEGVLMYTRSVPLGDDIYGVDFEMTVSRIERPIPTRSFQLLPHASQVTLSEPVLHEVELGSTLRITPARVSP